MFHSRVSQTLFVVALTTTLALTPAAEASKFVDGRLGHLDSTKASIESVQSSMKALLTQHFDAQEDQDVELIDVSMDAKGNRHLRFAHHYNGLPVVGSEVMMHVDSTGEIFAVNGDFASSQWADTVPALTGEQALLSLGKSLGRSHSAPELTYLMHEGEMYLAWQTTVDYFNQEGAQRDVVFVDAVTGRKLARHPQYHYARSLRTYDCNNGTSCGSLISSSSNNINTGDAAADSAHNFAIATYDYYLSEHGRDSIDDNGMTLVSRVHYGSNYNNAFWNGSQMTYGDGDGVTFIALSRDADVVAHELTHGVTERESGLIYANESGALNEAMSDIFGAMVDRELGESETDIWLIGEDIYTPGIGGDALRNMADPAAQGDYDYYPTRYTGSADNGGVHWNSGIANLAFYLLVKGGTHPRGKTTVNVPAIGYDKAADIFYYANTNCLTSSSNFQAARSCTAQGASALYGVTEVLAVHKAWDAVGVPGGLSPVRVTLSGPTSRNPGQSGTWYCSVVGGLGPYSRTWFKTSTAGVTDLGSNYSQSTSDLNTFNIVCDVRDAANQFDTDYIPVNVNGDPGFPPLPF